MTVKIKKNGEKSSKYGGNLCLILDTERITTATGPKFCSNLEDIKGYQ